VRWPYLFREQVLRGSV